MGFFIKYACPINFGPILKGKSYLHYLSENYILPLSKKQKRVGTMFPHIVY